MVLGFVVLVVIAIFTPSFLEGAKVQMADNIYYDHRETLVSPHTYL
jgi:hypothetical protein